VRDTGKSALPPTVIITPWAVALENPGALTRTLYDPGGNAKALYSPCPLPAAGRSTAFASSRTVTAAFVTSLPPGSFTVMRRSPVATPWANASRAQTAARNSVKQIRGIRIGFSDARILLTGLSAAQSCVKREIYGKRRFAGFYITL